jgi:hypothetical protein
MEAAPRLDGRTDDDELRAAFGGDARDLAAEAPRPRAHDLAPHRDAVRARERLGRLQPLSEAGQLAVHVRGERQLALDDERADDDDAGAAVGREPAREIERVLGLLPVEQRHDDRAVGDRLRPQREPPESSDVRPSHRSRW